MRGLRPFLWIVLLCAGCAGDLPAPWEGLSLSADTASAIFRAHVGDELPGVGAYATASGEARDGARVQVLEVQGATWPVVQVQVFGRGEGGLNVLELDVSLDRWVAGEVPVDGVAAVGALTLAGGEVRYVVSGVLRLEAAGLAVGELAEGTLEGAGLTEVAP
jgi:hypothetical protein